ncbi:helix-turn-helix domain-containing protein [Chakrabartyella piscis]|uniref:helix-turn-helix domain-containing protein n=1 Tax=Chakrabartyella piscis TaxID=2918914 RepID=UPI0029587482|nr:helix-turn-helix domain-containing protein [Chakrabartyella piscis]
MTNIVNEVLEPQNVLPTFEEKKKVYTVDEIQDILGIGLSTTYKLIKSRQFHSVKVGHRVLVPKKGFDEWLGL